MANFLLQLGYDYVIQVIYRIDSIPLLILAVFVVVVLPLSRGFSHPIIAYTITIIYEQLQTKWMASN